MYAITGITGKVGGEVARNLLAAGLPVRAVLRDGSKAGVWRERGCEIAQAEMSDAAALTGAFSGASGVFILLPPVFDPAPGFAETRSTLAALHAALTAARPAKLVCLSTIGAQAKQENLLTQLGLMEESLGALPMPVTFLRPAWFMENFSWDIAPARQNGVIPSFLQPLDKPFPMIATADVGRVAAESLMDAWTGKRIVELEGAARVSPNEIAGVFSRVLGRSVHAEIVPRDTWEALFRSQGMKNPLPRIQMLNGFNAGWIEFEFDAAERRIGRIEFETVLKALLKEG